MSLDTQMVKIKKWYDIILIERVVTVDLLLNDLRMMGMDIPKWITSKIFSRQRVIEWSALEMSWAHTGFELLPGSVLKMIDQTKIRPATISEFLLFLKMHFGKCQGKMLICLEQTLHKPPLVCVCIVKSDWRMGLICTKYNVLYNQYDKFVVVNEKQVGFL